VRIAVLQIVPEFTLITNQSKLATACRIFPVSNQTLQQYKMRYNWQTAQQTPYLTLCKPSNVLCNYDKGVSRLKLMSF